MVEIQPRDRKRFRKLLRGEQGRRQPADPHAPDRRGGGALRRQRYRFPGVEIKARLFRHYPMGEVASHVLGYIGRISDSDLERLEADGVQRELQGLRLHRQEPASRRATSASCTAPPASTQVEIDAGGRGVRTLSRTAPIAGNNLVAHARRQAAGGRRAGVRRLPRRAGRDRADDRRRARASCPSPATTPTCSSTASTRRAGTRSTTTPTSRSTTARCTGAYPPGSTFKPFMALVALELGKRTPEYTICDPGFFMLPGARTVPRLEGRRPRRGRHAQVDRDLVRHLLLRPRQRPGHRQASTASSRSSASASRPASTSTARRRAAAVAGMEDASASSPDSRSGTPAKPSRSASARATTLARRCSSRSRPRSSPTTASSSGRTWCSHVEDARTGETRAGRAAAGAHRAAQPEVGRAREGGDGRRHATRRHRGARRSRAPIRLRRQDRHRAGGRR